MREVEASRYVAAKPPEVRAALDPAAVVEAEGSFDVRDVSETPKGTVVTAGRFGVTLRFRFEEREDGLAYEQIEGPLSTLETTVTARPKNEGTELRGRSTVAVRGPDVLDRLAAWKRRGELERGLLVLSKRG
ncbi:SRPBCC family protein [Halorarum salinum]|uniref:SRPBCC family protein n=1 Tax=Halorarum salinum TaxID=2743089 RepID=A0A7D5QFE0_9EURY|nr:SRPBCC family protein [Halobaculum salinum]QLG60604.1 SRPBCC family protein [Halobaculum salinum]